MKKVKFSKNEIRGTLLVLLTAIVSGFSIIANKFFVVKIDPLLLTAMISVALYQMVFIIGTQVEKLGHGLDWVITLVYLKREHH